MIERRSFLRGLALGAATPLLGPLVGRLVREARGQTSRRQSLVVITDGNGWGHQSMNRNSELLDTRVDSETDWDLPSVLAPFAPFADRVTIARRFNNFGSLHGSGWSTLTGVRSEGQGPGGISLDRLVARAQGQEDAFSSIALGVSTRNDRPPPCTSADGRLQPFPAFGAPTEAHRALFGGVAGAGADAESSLLDRLVDDVSRTRAGLASHERAHLDQMLASYRSLETQLVARRAIFETRPPPEAPGVEGSTLQRAVIEAHADLVAQAIGFGLTHVAHLSLLGFDAHNVGWGFLGHPGDAHEQVAHVSGPYNRAASTAAYRDIITFKAEVIARMYGALAEIPVEGGTAADRTVFVWINSGGGKHHHGNNYHPVVVIGDAGGRLRAGHYLELSSPRFIGDAFLAIAQGLGVEVDGFGDPERSAGPAPLLA